MAIGLTFSFLLGAALGSFVNMASYRLRHGSSLLKKRSYCDHCKKELDWRSLLPIFSFVLATGRSRCCQKRLSLTYPLVELAMGLLFLASYLSFSFSPWEMARAWIFLVILALVLVLDARFYLVHVGSVIAALVAAVAINATLGTLGTPVLSMALGALLGAGFYAFQYAISRGKWVGSGDMWLGGLLGAMFGWGGLLVLLFFSYIIAPWWGCSWFWRQEGTQEPPAHGGLPGAGRLDNPVFR